MPASNRTARSTTVMPTDARQNAHLARYICTAMILPRKNGFPHNMGTHGQVTRGYTRRRMANRFSQNESGTHFSPPGGKTSKPNPSHWVNGTAHHS